MMEGEQKVKRFTLAKLGIDLRKLVAEKLRHLNVREIVIVTRKGRPEAQVQVQEDGSCCSNTTT